MSYGVINGPTSDPHLWGEEYTCVDAVDTDSRKATISPNHQDNGAIYFKIRRTPQNNLK